MFFFFFVSFLFTHGICSIRSIHGIYYTCVAVWEGVGGCLLPEGHCVMVGLR